MKVRQRVYHREQPFLPRKTRKDTKVKPFFTTENTEGTENSLLHHEGHEAHEDNTLSQCIYADSPHKYADSGFSSVSSVNSVVKPVFLSCISCSSLLKHKAGQATGAPGFSFTTFMFFMVRKFFLGL